MTCQTRIAGGDGWGLERTGFPQTRGGAAETPPRSTLHEAPLETSGGVAQVLEVGAAGGGRVCNDLDDQEAAVARLVADAGEADLAQLEDDVRPDLRRAPKREGRRGIRGRVGEREVADRYGQRVRVVLGAQGAETGRMHGAPGGAAPIP